MDLAALLDAGRLALAEGDWAAAREAYGKAAATGSAEAAQGLAEALLALGDYDGAIARGEEAYTGFRARGEDVAAASSARLVGYLYGVVHGNGAVMSGWMGRAASLLESAGDCRERARLELTRATLAGDDETRERHLEAAVAIARRSGDEDLVFDAMSVRGLHRVVAGDVGAGMALLDEALAAVAAGEVRDATSVGAMYCKMLHACEVTSDVRRAEEWLGLADRWVERSGRVPIRAICRTHYGGVLTAAGRWDEAEAELRESVELYDRSYRALRGAAVVRLGALRVRQGRLAEAGELLAEAEHDAYAVRPLVELHVARGEPDLAVARVERFLREHARDDGALLLLAVRAHLARGDRTAAVAASARLDALAAATDHPAVAATACHARGLVGEDAVRHLEAAVAAFAAQRLPLEEARARLDLASVLAADGSAMAVVEARGALATFQALRAARDADAATSLLRRLGVRGHSGPRGSGVLTPREEEVLALLGDGLSNADIAARLFVSPRTAEHHVSNILAKLGLGSRAEATAYAVRNGVSG
ncbi:MAG TPA: LuxR C-terminal-related transcriptional regulator [Frankiaceae bacterium]|nr:LuxR C-terminal-related transcriptional regulator [Frankiaceae bacterium]